MSSTGLMIESVAYRVWHAVRAVGPLGLSSAALADELPDLSRKSLENVLWRLKLCRYIAHDKPAHVYLVNETCIAPVVRHPATPRGRLLEMIGDCEAGVSADLLCYDLRMTQERVLKHLAGDLASGHVRKIEMPASHGGGMGFLLCVNAQQQPKRAAPPTLASMASGAAPAALGCTLPELSGSADGRGEFALLGTGQFVIGWGDSFMIKLPRDVTRSMFRYLDKLGGLNNEQRLPGAEGGAP